MLKERKFLFAIVSVLAVLYYGLVTYVAPNYIKQFVPTAETLAQNYINGSVRIGRVSWGGGLSAQVHDVLVQDKDEQTVVQLPQTVLHLRPWLILGGVEKIVTKIELVQPQVNLVMAEDYTWNMQHLLKPSDSETTPFYGLLKITDAKLNVQLPNAQWDVLVNGNVDGGANPHFAVAADVALGKDVLNLQGIITTKGVGNLILKTKELDIAPYAPALAYLEQVYDSKGKVRDLHLRWSNDDKGIHFNGDAKLEKVSANLQTGLGLANVFCDGADIAVVTKSNADKLKTEVATVATSLRFGSLQIDKLAFDIALEDGDVLINNFSALAGKNGSLLASGMLAKNGALQLTGRMAEFPVHPFLDVAGQNGSGYCSTGFNIGGTLNTPEFDGILQLTDVAFMQQKLTEAHGRIAMRDNVLTIDNFIAHMQQGKHVVNGSVDLRGGEPAFNLSVETNGVRAEPLVAIASPDLKVTGNVDNLVQLTGTLSKPSISGEVTLTDGSAYGYLLEKVQGRYAYHDEQVDLRNFIVDALSAEIFLDGTMTKEQQLDFVMQASNVDIERLPLMASDIDLRGLINLNGKLSGTLAYPRFQGDVNSEQITVNGEPLSELSGSLDSNGREKNTLNVRFKQPYEQDSSNYGLFTADLNLDFVQKFTQGKVMTLWGNLGGILRMAKFDYAIDGTTQGVLDFNPRGKGSGVDINVWVDEVKIHDLDYYRMLFKGQFLQGVLTMEDVRLQEKEAVEDKGIITLGGMVDLRNKTLDLNMNALQANPGVVTALMKDPPALKGAMDLQLVVNGTFADPSGKAELSIMDGSISGVSVDTLQAQAVLKNDNIHLQQFTAMKDIYGVSAAGDIPMDLFRQQEERRNPEAQMNIAIDLEHARLGMLPVLTKLVAWGEGATEGTLTLAGTLEEPLVFGSVKIADGRVKLADAATVIDKIQADVEFMGNEVLLHNFSTQLGKGGLTANGNYALRADDAPPYRLHVKAQDAELASEIFSGRINSEVEIVPQKYRERGSRQNNKPAPSAYRPLIKGNVHLDDVLINMPTIPEMGEGGSNIALDMQVELGKKIHFFNKYLYDMWLSGKMQIKGSTIFPIIEGQVRADKGSVTYLRTPFKLKNASVNWLQPGSFLPNVNLESEARFSRYDIYMRITGPVETMDLQLSSNPPLEKNTIVRMLTLQRDSAGNDEVSSEDMANLMTAGLQMTVLGDVEMLVKQTLGLDQFRIYTGKVRSGIGFESVRDRNHELTPEERNSYNMLVSKYLGSRLMAGYTTSFNGIDRSFFGQYDISRRMNFTYSRSYDLSDEAEDWFGIEYKVNFN